MAVNSARPQDSAAETKFCEICPAGRRTVSNGIAGRGRRAGRSTPIAGISHSAQATLAPNNRRISGLSTPPGLGRIRGNEPRVRLACRARRVTESGVSERPREQERGQRNLSWLNGGIELDHIGSLVVTRNGVLSDTRLLGDFNLSAIQGFPEINMAMRRGSNAKATHDSIGVPKFLRSTPAFVGEASTKALSFLAAQATTAATTAQYRSRLRRLPTSCCRLR